MKIYTDYLSVNSKYYSKNGIDLDSLFNRNVSDSSKFNYFKSKLPTNATIRLIDGKQQIVPSGDLYVHEENFVNNDVIFKSKFELNKANIELNVYPIQYEGDDRWFYDIEYKITKADGSNYSGEVLGNTDAIIYKDLRNAMHCIDVTEWDYVFDVTLNLHDHLAENNELDYNDAEFTLTMWINQMITVLKWEINKILPVPAKESVKVEEFPESLDGLDDQTKEQIKMIVNKAKNKGLNLTLDTGAIKLGQANTDNEYSLNISKGNLEFIDKDHTTNIEIDPDDSLSTAIYDFIQENLTVATDNKLLVDYLNETSKDEESIQIYQTYYSSISKLCTSDYDKITEAVTELKTCIEDPSVLVSIVAEDTIHVTNPDTREVVWSCEWIKNERSNSEKKYYMKVSGTAAGSCICTLFVPNSCKDSVWNYMSSLIYK